MTSFYNDMNHIGEKSRTLSLTLKKKKRII